MQLKEVSERELRHTKDLLTQSEKLSQLGTMVVSIGHEIATPVSVVDLAAYNGQCELNDLEKRLMALFDGDEELVAQSEFFEDKISRLRKSQQTIDTASERLKYLSGSLRNQSRMEQQATPRIAINEVLKESLVLVSGRTKHQQTNVALQDLPEITGFRSKIGQVLTNLLANAADALNEKAETQKDQTESDGQAPFKGKISVTSETCEKKGQAGVLVAIADNGDGVPQAIKDKIFTQFFTTKPAGVGTGLGLSLCMDIVKEHGGLLSVTDDAELGGARFELWLPLGNEQTSSAA